MIQVRLQETERLIMNAKCYMALYIHIWYGLAPGFSGAGPQSEKLNGMAKGSHLCRAGKYMIVALVQG